LPINCQFESARNNHKEGARTTSSFFLTLYFFSRVSFLLSFRKKANNEGAQWLERRQQQDNISSRATFLQTFISREDEIDIVIVVNELRTAESDGARRSPSKHN
jgi:hypothetical protein